LKDEAIREVIIRENTGRSYEYLFKSFELALHAGKGLVKQVAQTTIEDYISILTRYTKDWFKIPVSEIKRFDVLEVLNKIETEGKSNSRKRVFMNALNKMFIWGIDNRIVTEIDHSPAFGIKVSRVEPKKPEILTINEIRKLLESARDLQHTWYPIWAFALMTGMRSGELNALLWNDIDWEKRLITVSKSYNGRLKIVKSTKAGYWRDVPMNSELEILLKELRVSANGRQQVLPRIIDWDRGESARILRSFCEGIGIPSVKFHALRACFATQLLRDRVAPATVMKICGWKDLKTMQCYIRLAGIEIEGATECLKVLPERQALDRVVELFGKP